jgi:hypothetical protein
MLARHQEAVAGEQGPNVEEGDGVVALEHDLGGPLAEDDLAEDAVGVVHRTALVSAG